MRSDLRSCQKLGCDTAAGGETASIAVKSGGSVPEPFANSLAGCFPGGRFTLNKSLPVMVAAEARSRSVWGGHRLVDTLDIGRKYDLVASILYQEHRLLNERAVSNIFARD